MPQVKIGLLIDFIRIHGQNAWSNVHNKKKHFWNKWQFDMFYWWSLWSMVRDQCQTGFYSIFKLSFIWNKNFYHHYSIWQKNVSIYFWVILRSTPFESHLSKFWNKTPQWSLFNKSSQTYCEKSNQYLGPLKIFHLAQKLAPDKRRCKKQMCENQSFLSFFIHFSGWNNVFIGRLLYKILHTCFLEEEKT